MSTDVGATMQARADTTPWNTPCWGAEAGAGGVTPGEGQLLYGLVRAMRPLMVLEVGTGYGHGTLHLAAGCRDNGRGLVYTVEIHDGRQAAARENAAEADLNEWIIYHRTIPDEVFDFAFLDAGHEAADVNAYLDALQLRPGGVIAVHDARWVGHVAEVAARRGLRVMFLPTDSLCGMALLTEAA
jgi:predicted O-methyltransferase YrrM